MTTLYHPVLIETAEQAEALPVGTVAEIRDEDGWHDVAVKIGRNDWRTAAADSVMDWGDGYVVDWTALVPIEAEEVRVVQLGLLERDMHGRTILNHQPDVPGRDYRRTEYHTPWEEV